MKEKDYNMKVPKEIFEEIRQLVKDVKIMIELLHNSQNSSPLGGWIPESEAQKLLGRKTTWFYYKRKSGELTGKKRGGKWWYQKSDIQKFIES